MQNLQQTLKQIWQDAVCVEENRAGGSVNKKAKIFGDTPFQLPS